MEDILANAGLWYALTSAEKTAAIKFGNMRQAHAISRRAELRFDPETPDEILADQHVGQATFEAGVARALGLKNLQRLNTDHQYARLDLPDGTGIWPRACRRIRPAYIKGLEADFGLLIGGRVWNDEEVNGEFRTVVEVRCWADIRIVRKCHDLERPKNGGPYYRLFWGFKECWPIRTLVDKYQLDTGACLCGPPASVSRSIIADYPPPNPEPIQCEDGCKAASDAGELIPRSVGGFVCKRCGFYLFRKP